VYELDRDPHGPELQDALERLTGRRSVPNCIFCGTSKGGGSEMAELHSHEILGSTLLEACKGRSVSIDGMTA
jgi:glutaredoxin